MSICVLFFATPNIGHSGAANPAFSQTSMVAGQEQYEMEQYTQNLMSSSMAIDSEPCTISERLGDKIDRIEKEYFGLFPNIIDFTEASCFVDESGNASIVIARGDSDISEDTVILVNARAVDELVNLMEHYESVSAQKHYVNYKLISDFAELPAVLEATVNAVKVSTIDGKEYNLRILCAGDSSIVLWKGIDDYDWRLNEKAAVYLPYHMIHSISIRRESEHRSPLPYAAGGALVGGVIGGFVGYSGGDDDPGSVLPMKAEDKAMCCAGCGGLLGCLAGGGIGFVSNRVKGRDERFEINGDYRAYDSLRPIIDKNSMLQGRIPPELRTENWVGSGTGVRS
jgi:hypothetical protein